MSKKAKRNVCLKIQWSDLAVSDDGKPICPDCKRPAELVLGFYGNPCWAHERKQAAEAAGGK